jgi:hypothetical protein
VPPVGAIAGETATNPPGGLDLTIPLVLLLLAAVAVVLARTLRREPPVTPVAGAPAEEPPVRWIPWFRSPMRGPGWNDPRPPSDRPGEWSDAEPPPPPAAPEQHEEWTPPTRRSPTHRR